MTDRKPPSEEPGRRKPSSEYHAEETEVSRKAPEKVQQQALTNERKNATLGLIVGAAIVIIGVILILLGFTSTVDITFQSGSTKGHIVTGSIGVVVVLVGGTVTYINRYRVKITDGQR